MMGTVTDQDTDIPATEHVDQDTADQALPVRRKRHIDKTLLAVSVLVGLGLALMFRGVLISITGDERAKLPDLIERVDPVPESVQVLSQSNVFVDLVSGYTGVLVVDGTEIETVSVEDLGSIQVVPGQQVQLPSVTIFEPGNSTLTFVPSKDAPVSEFAEGEHRAQVIYWKVTEGRERARSYTWTFNVV